MKFGIISAKNNPQAVKLSKDISKYLKLQGHQVIGQKDLTRTDLVIVLGGDGTLLHSACENVKLGVAHIGVNVGTLGFLTAAEAENWQSAVDKLIEGKYFVSERMTLETYTKPETKYRALNEVVVKSAFRVVGLEILVNGEDFLTISGDGVIISTQTGSTAYSLSSGGPIVDPEIDCILITPISAHGLPIPSVVLSADDKVEIKIKSGNDISLIIDGRDHKEVKIGQKLQVFKGKEKVKFVYFDKHQFLKSLHAKFGLSKRLAIK